MWEHFRIASTKSDSTTVSAKMRLPKLEGIEELPGTLKEFGGTYPLGRANASKILRRTIDPYTTRQIPKRNGSVRHISEPNSYLKSFQSMLLREFLNEPEVAHSAAYAYVIGKSAVQCARVHSTARWAVKVDIVDFFESIDEKQIFWALRSRGVSNYRAFFLARFCTRLELQPNEVKKSLRDGISGSGTPSLRKYKIIQRHNLLKKFDVKRRRIGYLPQGSPTSGQISNLVLYPLDNRLDKMAKSLSAKYSRYADDMIFSFTTEFNRVEADKVLSEVGRLVNEAGFQLNNEKTRVLKPGSRMQILGLLIGDPGLRIPKEKKQKLDKALRAVEKFGFESHTEFIDEVYSFKVLNQLHGFLIWANEVEPGWAGPRLKLLSKLASEQLAD